MMNASVGYVGLRNDNPEQTSAVVPIDLLHLGEHFSDIPQILIKRHQRQMAQIILPRTVLFEMIADGHWKRPTRSIK